MHFEKEVGPVVLTNIKSAKFYTKRKELTYVISCTWSVPLVFLQCLYLSNAGLEQPRSDLIFKHSILHNGFIFGMLYHHYIPVILTVIWVLCRFLQMENKNKRDECTSFVKIIGKKKDCFLISSAIELVYFKRKEKE